MTEAFGTVIGRMFPFLLTLAAIAMVGFLFTSFIDRVQSWAVLHDWAGQMLN